MNRAASHHDILILGAGAAGLALGYELKQRGLSFLILEQGAAAGESWRRMPTHLKLVSPWKANFLPGTRPNLWPRHYEMSRDEFHRYLRDYAAANSLPVQTEAQVTSVTRDQGHAFRVETSQGVFTGRLLVNATGYFSKPFVPEIPGAGATNIPQLHVADYRDPRHFKQRFGFTAGLVLIVGKRLSAGQTLVELIDAGFEVALSHRSPIRYGPGPLALWLFFRIFLELESIQLRLKGAQAPGWNVKMPGGRARQLIERGTVKTFPGIRGFEESSVVFENGATLKPSAVIYATGFRSALDHLRLLLPELATGKAAPVVREMESVEAPGIFFAGLDHQRNFQSRYLRGIRRDVVILANQLQSRLLAGPERRLPARQFQSQP